MLTSQQRTALLNYQNPEHWPVAVGIVADAMNGDASLLKLIGSGPGLCAHILVPSGDDVDKPSLVVVVDRTHQTPGILVFQDRDEGAREFNEIVEFALNMRGTGRLPELVEGGLQRWTEGSGGGQAAPQ